MIFFHMDVTVGARCFDKKKSGSKFFWKSYQKIANVNLNELESLKYHFDKNN